MSATNEVSKLVARAIDDLKALKKLLHLAENSTLLNQTIKRLESALDLLVDEM